MITALSGGLGGSFGGIQATFSVRHGRFLQGCFGIFIDVSNGQPKVDQLTICINRTPLVTPLSANPDVGFIDMPI